MPVTLAFCGTAAMPAAFNSATVPSAFALNSLSRPTIMSGRAAKTASFDKLFLSPITLNEAKSAAYSFVILLSGFRMPIIVSFNPNLSRISVEDTFDVTTLVGRLETVCRISLPLASNIVTVSGYKVSAAVKSEDNSRAAAVIAKSFFAFICPPDYKSLYQYDRFSG